MKKEQSRKIQINANNEFEIIEMTKYTLSASEAADKLTGNKFKKPKDVKDKGNSINLKYSSSHIPDTSDICIHNPKTKSLYFKSFNDYKMSMITCPDCGKSFQLISMNQNEFTSLNFADDNFISELIDNLFIYYQYNMYDKKILDRLLYYKNKLNTTFSLTASVLSKSNKTELLALTNKIQEALISKGFVLVCTMLGGDENESY